MTIPLLTIPNEASQLVDQLNKLIEQINALSGGSGATVNTGSIAITGLSSTNGLLQSVSTTPNAVGYLNNDGVGNFTYSNPAGAGTVTTTGSPSNGNLSKFSGSTSITNGDLSGDITTAGTLATSLATVNPNVGSFTYGSFTVNGKGLITAASNGTTPATLSFTTIAVSGQSNVVADSATDTLTLVAGTNVTITTDAATDSVTINSSGGGGSGTVTTTGSPASGNLSKFSGATSITNGDLSGDVTTAGTLVSTLKNTGTAGTYGQVTTDAQGRVTAGATNDVAHGGTGVATLTAYAVLCGGTTSTNPVQSIASVGTAGQVLTSNGAAALPTFQAASGGGTNLGLVYAIASGNLLF